MFEILFNLVFCQIQRGKLKSRDCLLKIFDMSFKIAKERIGNIEFPNDSPTMSFDGSPDKTETPESSPVSPVSFSAEKGKESSEKEKESPLNKKKPLKSAKLEILKEISSPEKKISQTDHHLIEKRILGYTCLLAQKMSYHVKEDFAEIIRIKMLGFLVIIGHSSFSDSVRKSALKALSILSSCPKMFEEFKETKALELIFNVCQDNSEIPETKQSAL